MNLKCKGCGGTVEVASMLDAAQQACPLCGQYILSGGFPEPEALRLGREERITETAPARGPAERPAPRHPSQIANPMAQAFIIVLGVVNILFGTLQLACGFFLTWGTSWLQGPAGEKMLRDMKVPPHLSSELTRQTKVVMYITIAMIVASSLLIFAGISLIRREPVGRYLTLGFGVVAGVLALFGLINCDPCSTSIYGSYSMFAITIMLMFGEEFEGERGA